MLRLVHAVVPCTCPHSYMCQLLTALQGKVAYLFVSSASDKQWSKGEKHLRQALETFRV